MVCSVDGYPQKVVANTIGETQMIQVFSFINMHNHLVDDATFGKPVIHTKQKGALVDDVIKGRTNYLPRQLCKDFER